MNRQKKIGKYFLIISSFVLYFISVTVGNIFADGTFYNGIVLSLLVSFFSYGLITIIYDKIYEEKRDNTINFKITEVFRIVIVATLALFVCYFFRNGVFCILYGVQGYVPEEYLPLVENIVYEHVEYSIYKKVVLIVVIGIAIPIMEELFFRYFLQDGFKEIPYVYRFVAVNVCFVFLHKELDSMLLILPMSILCSLLLYKTKSLWYSIFIHCLVNIIGVVECPVNKGIFSPEYVIKYGEVDVAYRFAICNIFVSGLLVIAILLIVKKKKKEVIDLQVKASYKRIGWYVVLALLYVIEGRLL